MNFSFTEDHNMIAQMVKDFTEKEIRANVRKWDEEQHFPKELFKKAGELGLMGVLVPEEFGGAGLGYFEYIAVIAEISKACGSNPLSSTAREWSTISCVGTTGLT